MAVHDLMAFAQSAIELRDNAMGKQAMKQARAMQDESVMELLLQSGLIASTQVGRARAVSEKARKAAADREFRILTEGDFSFLQSVEYECPVGHHFVAKPKSFAQLSQPCPICAESEVSRLQINVRLSLDYSEKYLDLIEYYKCQKSISFLDEELPSESFSNSLGALGRFLLETAIDDAYLELQDKKLIEEIASWIDFDAYKNITIALGKLNGEPLSHKRENSDEWKKFLDADGGRLENDYLKFALSQWGEQLGDAYFTQFWNQALLLALQNYQANHPEKKSDSEQELARRIKRWKRNG